MKIESLSMIPRYIEQSSWWQHVPIAHWIMAEIKPKTVVELGTHFGVSFFALCEAAEKYSPQSFVYAVDSWEGDSHSGKYNSSVLDRVREHWLKTQKHNSRLIKSKFEDAVNYFPNSSIDLLHVDGLHTYEAVKNDYETWKDKLKEQAIIMFHDINVREKGFGAWRFWEELKQDGKYQTLEILNGHGLGIAYNDIHSKSIEEMSAILPVLKAKGIILERMAKAELKLKKGKE